MICHGTMTDVIKENVAVNQNFKLILTHLVTQFHMFIADSVCSALFFVCSVVQLLIIGMKFDSGNVIAVEEVFFL